MITLTNASLQLGSKQLLVNANLTVHPGQKLGLIGANGSGKTSLFKLLLNQLHIDAGDFQLPKQWRIAHMAQEVNASNRTALDYILDGDKQLRQLQSAVESHIHEGEKLARLYEQLETIDAYTAPARAQRLLHGLGFLPGDENKLVDDFSGGWRIRLNLAQSLMCPSDLLLLDEPTNHLDLDATLWLERWLQGYSGTLIIISHDRDFLDNVVNQIVNLERHTLTAYSGNYSAFEGLRAAQLIQQQSSFEKQQQRIAEIESFVRRFKAKASKARQAQSRLKELERMEKLAPAHIDTPFTFSIPAAEKISTPLLSLADADIGYSTAIIKKLNLSILPETRIGLLGANGAGKSTLIKTLANQLPVLTGTRVDGENLKIGYFAQHQLEALDLEATAALHLQRLSPQISEQAIRNYLGSFGFQGNRVFETIHHFSGGEKARLALALVTWQKPNLLLLDEPTNHLDLEMRHALTLALQTFQGAVIVVSHDRHLLRNTVDEFLLVEKHKVESFNGNLEDYEQWLVSRNRKSDIATADTITPDTTTPAGTTEENYSGKSTVSTSAQKTDKRSLRQAAASRREQLKPLTKKLKQQEKTIEKYNRVLQEVEQQLADPGLYASGNEQSGNEQNNNANLQALLKQQGSLRQQLIDAEEDWLTISEEIEQMQSEF